MKWVVDFFVCFSINHKGRASRILAQPFLISRRPSPGNNKGQGQFLQLSFVRFILEPIVHGHGRFRERVETAE